MKSSKSGGGIVKCFEAVIIGQEGPLNRREELKGLAATPSPGPAGAGSGSALYHGLSQSRVCTH